MRTKFESFMLTFPFLLALVLIVIIIATHIDTPAETEPDQSVAEYSASEIYSPRVTVTVPYHDDVTLTASGVRYCDAVPLDVGMQLHCQEMCKKYNVPYPLLLGLIEAESSFQEDADSGWAYGLAQIGYIMEDTFAEQHLDIFDPYDNIECACIILGDYLSRYKPNLALMAYNMGESGAKELWDESIYETDYTRKVLQYRDKWEERLR